jgi:mRNA-degrading endonuclease toxin of MazEF toxin-antitoxin module
MKRGEVYRTSHRRAERGHKPGYYVVVSRGFIAENDDISTVICAPVYGEILGLATEVVVGPEEGIPRSSAVRCDFLMLMFKDKLTTRAGRLSGPRLQELNRALARALDLPATGRTTPH